MSYIQLTDNIFFAPIFDERERASGLLDYLFDHNLPYTVCTLAKGDFTVSDRVGGEIKRIKKKKKEDARAENDLVSSIFDGRIYDQISGLRELYQINILILEIENGATLFTTDFTDEGWKSLRLELEICFNTHIFKTSSKEETADLIYSFWEREKKGEHFIAPTNKQPKPKSLKDQQIYFLSGLCDVGYEKAKELINTYSTPLNIIDAIIKTPIEYTPSGTPKKPKDAPHGFGAQFFLKNQSLLLGDIHEKTNSNTHTTD
jgi:DNA excision repair protein ERCC-4